ncbi:MAG: 6,7-dimethyl-8-ribityllumazine synthase [Candidatus Scalindua sp.]|jgi:6,7-dimethyl-8-ribityllumazine synthase|nr:6,7-dimethyl-8-ribityllumazine synthase [Candidatus Scalindua sp.]MDP7530039.1 6,7-dimethyl-8-ribityllumazine synthase [Candidatus Scalindua sp.]|tara:strand:+ start:325 stop:792 length:468 start_codon:yes stop_codon:yes gene_type:complete
MVKSFEGNLIGKNKTFGIVVSRFNSFITKKLLEGAQDCLIRHGIKEDDIDVFWVPGACELPITAMRLAKNAKHNGIVCLGAVIRGETPHFDYVSSEAAKGISEVGLQTGIPTIYGVITTDTLEQAIDRAGARGGNKGSEAALAALEMVNLFDKMK